MTVKNIELEIMIVDVNYVEPSERAKKRSKEMIENGLYSRFKYNYDERVEKAYIGYLGELAFREYLNNENIQYTLNDTHYKEENSDDYDLLINGRTIDIKVANKKTNKAPNDNWTFGYPEEQKPITKDYIIVGWINEKNEEIGFYGWIEEEVVSMCEIVQENSYAGYYYKTANHEFTWGVLNKDFTVLFNRI